MNITIIYTKTISLLALASAQQTTHHWPAGTAESKYCDRTKLKFSLQDCELSHQLNFTKVNKSVLSDNSLLFAEAVSFDLEDSNHKKHGGERCKLCI